MKEFLFLLLLTSNSLVAIYEAYTKLPYYPIEISRLLATGGFYTNITFILTIIVGLILYPKAALLFLCTLGIVLFDDVYHWNIYMICVFGLFMSYLWCFTLDYILVYNVRRKKK